MLPVTFQQFLLSHNLTQQQFHCSTAKGRLFGGGLFSFYFFTKWSSHLIARCGRIHFVNVEAAGIANTFPDFRPDFLGQIKLTKATASVVPLKPAQQYQDDQNQNDQAKPATRVVTPISAVRPSGQGTQQHQNQQDDQYSS
jgi:hypothetical protein